LSAGSFALARTAGEAGLRLIRGRLLADEPHATWATGERAAAERLVAQARLIVAQALNSGDAAGAADHAAAVVESDPYDEAALRLLMQAYAASNRPALAIAAYGRARERLTDELGIEPAPATEEVFLHILRQEPFPFAPTRLGARQNEQGGATLPGRTLELQALDAALERAAAGHVELLLVEGEAGIGKSRLLRTWAVRAAASGVQVLSANCDELERSLPLQPVADALDGYLRGLPTPAAVVEALGPQHAVLAALLRASPQPPQPAALDPVGGQATLFSALLAVFERLGQQALLVLLLDDLHLADRASVAWLHFAARHAVGLRLLVVGALRTEEAVQLPQARRVHLGPLDVEAARMVVGDARAVELHTRSGGHPLFLVELAGVEDGALPTSLREAIGARCERAGETASAALKTAALLGPTVDLDLLGSVLGRPPLELLSHLEAGAQRGLLQERDATFVFGHELVREALVAGMGSARRVVLHREAARTLAARPNPEPLAIAYHAHQGNNFGLAATAYARAATHAAERYDHIESERLLNLAVELSDSAPLRLQRARTRMLRGDLPGAEADALVAYEGGEGATALETAGWAAYYRRDFAAAERYADMGIRLGVGADRAACLALGGELHHSTGRLAEAERHLEEALATTSGDSTAFAPSVYLASLRRHQGRPRDALVLVDRMSRDPHALNLQLAPMTARMVAVHSLGMLGEADAALAHIRAWESAMERQGASRVKGRPANFKAWVLRALGLFEQAHELNLQALEEARGLGTGEAEAHALLDLADGQLRLGHLESAARYLDDAAPLQTRQHANRWRHELRYRLLRSRLAMAQGRSEEACKVARELSGDAREMGDVRYADLAFCNKSRLLRRWAFPSITSRRRPFSSDWWSTQDSNRGG
jgi:tetratricopeptide (TPR) repeat protein